MKRGLFWWLFRGAHRAAAEQQALLRKAEGMTPVIRQLAPGIASLPTEELERRMRQAFIRRAP